MTLDLYWREPLWLLALAYPLVVAGLGRWRARRQLDAYADRHLLPWVQAPRHRGGLARRGLLVLAWSLAVLGLAGPRVPLFVPALAQPPPGALVAVLDLSGSMAARDLGGSRRAAAVRALGSLVAAPRRPAIGLVVYAGRAHLYAPPTIDGAVLETLLGQVPALRLPTLGNDLAGALALARSQLAGVAGTRAVVLLSDGDLDPAAQERAERAAAALASDGTALTVVGVGTPTPTPVPDPDRGWLLHDGRPVVSRLEESWLRQLAMAAGGRYVRLPEAAGLPLDALWQAAPPRIAPDAVATVLWHELFPWLVAPAVVLLLLGAVLPSRRATGMILVATLSGASISEAAGPDLAAAQDALAAGEAVAARDRYRSIAGFAGRYGEGVACYRLEDYGCAIDAFSAAAWLTARDDERARAAYSLAAAFYQEGDYAQAAALYRDARANGLAEPALDRHIGLTETLAAQVERHRREAAGPQARKGAGFRTGSPELADQLAAGRTLEPEAEQEPPLPAGMDRKRFDALVARGVERARLAASGDGAATRHSARWLGRDDAAVETPGAALWQRLFEIEEGFNVSPERPRVRPEERPW